MTNDLTTFDFNGTAVRVLDQNGEPWFLASEVCAVLGYVNSRKAVLDHTTPSQRNTVTIRDGNRGNPNKAVISEGGVNSLILGSRLPTAQALKQWVTDVVLPAIRKDGMYVMGEEKVATGRGPPSIELNVAWERGTGTTIDREPRILDTDLAEALGYTVPAQIRRLIASHETSLRVMGTLITATVKTGGRPATAYYLNKSQAIFLTTQSGTATAIDITVQVVQKFDAYEKGLVPAAPAMPAIPTTFAEALRLAAEEVEEAERAITVSECS